METDDVYEKQLSYIIMSGKNRMLLFDQVQEAFQFFTISINNFKENLKKIAKMDDIQNLPPNVSCLADWAAKYLADDSLFQQMLQELQALITNDYHNLKNHYKEGISSIETNVELIQQKFAEDSENYNSIYEQYLDSCHKLEEIADSPDLSLSEPAKEKCYRLQCDAAKACEQLGIQRRECALQMEKNMIDFEKLEKANYKLFQDFLQKFCKITMDFGKNFTEIGQKSLNELKKIQYPKRGEEDEDIEPRDFSDLPPLEFNVFDFLSPKTVFSYDLSAIFMQVISPIKEQLGEFTSFEEGERVVLIQKEKDMYLIECERNAVRMYVPKSNLKPCKDYKRKIFVVDPPVPELGLNKKTYVVGILDHPETKSMRCRTASGDFAEIPIEHLTLYDKK